MHKNKNFEERRQGWTGGSKRGSRRGSRRRSETGSEWEASGKRVGEKDSKKGHEKPFLRQKAGKSRPRAGVAVRDTLQGACAPPHKGRGRGPLDTSPAVAGTQETMGGAGTQRSEVESPWRVSLTRPKLSVKYSYSFDSKMDSYYSYQILISSVANPVLRQKGSGNRETDSKKSDLRLKDRESRPREQGRRGLRRNMTATSFREAQNRVCPLPWKAPRQ